jgi:hypothetical protein
MEEGIDAIRSVLNTTADRWLELTNTLPDHLLRRKPAPGEWSAMECLFHLFNTERRVFPVRTGFFLAGVDLPNYDPDEEEKEPGPDVTPRGLAEDFAALRIESLKLLSGISASDLDKPSKHQVLGPVKLGELLHEWAAHDLMHTVQAERALMQPFIQASGAWRPFFADHDVDAS